MSIVMASPDSDGIELSALTEAYVDGSFSDRNETNAAARKEAASLSG